MENKIICKSCAAEFLDKLPKCPYCGTMNYKGAEAEYLNKLEDVREDMEDLEVVPKEAQKKEFRKQTFFWLKVIIGIICVIGLIIGLIFWLESRYERDERADFLWAQENVPKLDTFYEKEAYEELLTLYDAFDEDAPVWKWEHYDFMSIYNHMVWAEETLQREKDGYELKETDYVGLFFDMWSIKGMAYGDGIDEEERARLEMLSGDIMTDLENLFQMSEEDRKAFEQKLQNNGGFVRYDDCEAYVAEWYSGK